MLQRYVGHRPTEMTEKHYPEITQEAVLALAKKVCCPATVEEQMAHELGLVAVR